MLKKPKVNLSDGGFDIPVEIRETWIRAYPGVNIDQEAAKAFAWCRNNPRKSPKKDFGRFLNAWLGRAGPTQNNIVAGDLSDLLYKTGRVEAAYGEDMARRYDAKARELKSTTAADEWLKGELVCLRA